MLSQSAGDPQRLSLEDPKASSAAKRAFFRILERWDIGTDDARVLLGNPSRIVHKLGAKITDWDFFASPNNRQTLRKLKGAEYRKIKCQPTS